MKLYKLEDGILFRFYDGGETLSWETICELRIENVTDDLFQKLRKLSELPWNAPEGYAFSVVASVVFERMEVIYISYHSSSCFPSNDRFDYIARLDVDYPIKLEDISEYMKNQVISYFERKKEEAEKFIISLQTA